MVMTRTSYEKPTPKSHVTPHEREGSSIMLVGQFDQVELVPLVDRDLGLAPRAWPCGVGYQLEPLRSIQPSSASNRLTRCEGSSRRSPSLAAASIIRSPPSRTVGKANDDCF
ncbi:hypothetical protein A9Q02_21055 [Candidatus Chloroploca asiatica]|uniref:Uncharacterized protein n=1 Tax=Candidatus Chloroploca asiatica TaxID=1506545 RepID=A0A2H3KRS6_9CHLR|nr:hypothetical protein A9Q02_21055 [Candidatus Chloroploca asiatica]